MTRRTSEPPFNQQDSGRLGFRYEWEPVDERPMVVYRQPFWSSPDEERLWLRAVRSCPLSQYGDLDFFDYLAEVGKVAAALKGEHT
jgi:hypothetical protein